MGSIIVEAGGILAGGDTRYKANIEKVKYFYSEDSILNLIGGFQYIIEKYTNSVFKIEHTKKITDDKTIGTGFYSITSSIQGKIRPLIITNKHVVENAKQIIIYDKNDNAIAHKSIVIDPKNRDIAYILLETEQEVPFFSFNHSENILDEIITIGYPKIPMTNFSYQISHKGEINSFVENYEGNKMFLFSAKTAPGNSGSPIIDMYGLVVGIVTEELIEKDTNISPYYPGIPSSEILDFIINA